MVHHISYMGSIELVLALPRMQLLIAATMAPPAKVRACTPPGKYETKKYKRPIIWEMEKKRVSR